MSKVKSGQPEAATGTRRASALRDGLIAFAAHDLLPPDSHPERLEWIRKSYERFLLKVLEKEELVGVPPTDIS